MAPRPLYPLPTQDPISGEAFIVTRLECPASGVLLEGAFSLGWMAKLTTDQLDFVGALLKQRGNLQKLAPELGVSYTTARNRLDDIVTALGGNGSSDRPERLSVLEELSKGEIGFEEALEALSE